MYIIYFLYNIFFYLFLISVIFYETLKVNKYLDYSYKSYIGVFFYHLNGDEINNFLNKKIKVKHNTFISLQSIQIVASSYVHGL